MKKSLQPLIIVVLLLAIALYSTRFHIKAQSINGVPSQSMSGFTNVAVSTIAVGGATALNFEGIITSSSATPGSIGAGGCADTNYTFSGVPTGSVVSGLVLTSGTLATNINLAGYEPITSANTVAVRWCNNSLLATQTPTSGALKGLFTW